MTHPERPLAPEGLNWHALQLNKRSSDDPDIVPKRLIPNRGKLSEFLAG